MELINSIGMKLVLIPKGTFQMGSPESEHGRDDDETQHFVTLSKDFFLGVTVVTQAQYQTVIGENPSYFQGKALQGDSSNHPVECVSWNEAVEFCKRLSSLTEEMQAGRIYRLPTEAEWEYACRAGSKTAFGFGDEVESLNSYAWFSDYRNRKTHPVGQKKANTWGLYDMHGNVWEWCNCWYGKYPTRAVKDPTGPNNRSARVRRGGSWCNEATICRSAKRWSSKPSNRAYNYGFRVALSSPEIPKQAEPGQDK